MPPVSLSGIPLVPVGGATQPQLGVRSHEPGKPVLWIVPAVHRHNPTETMRVYRVQVYRLQEALHASEERCRYLERELQACRTSKGGGEGASRGRDAWSSLAKPQHLSHDGVAGSSNHDAATNASAQLERLVWLSLLAFLASYATSMHVDIGGDIVLWAALCNCVCESCSEWQKSRWLTPKLKHARRIL